MAFMNQDGFRLTTKTPAATGPRCSSCTAPAGNHLSWWQQVPVFAEEVPVRHRRSAGLRSVTGHAGWPGPAALRRRRDRAARPPAHLTVAVVAQSMGGWAAVGAAVQAPERFLAITLANTIGGLRHERSPGAPELAAESQGAGSPWHPARRTFVRTQPVRAFCIADRRAERAAAHGPSASASSASRPRSSATLATRVPTLS